MTNSGPNDDESHQSPAEVQNADSTDEAQTARIKYKYRKLLMQSKVKLPSRLALKLLGPDCAYRLFRHR